MNPTLFSSFRDAAHWPVLYGTFRPSSRAMEKIAPHPCRYVKQLVPVPAMLAAALLCCSALSAAHADGGTDAAMSGVSSTITTAATAPASVASASTASDLMPAQHTTPDAVSHTVPAVADAHGGGKAASISFEQAQQRMQQVSDKLAAAQAAAEGARLQAQALQSLGGPVLRLSAGATRYSLAADIDTTGARQTIASHLQQLGQALPIPPGLLSHYLPQLPDTIPLHLKGARYSQSLYAIWPIYTGGLLGAVRDVSRAREQEAQADVDMAAQELDTLLVQRYFTAQLAQRAADLRQQAVHAISQHDHAASRLLHYGMIARVERLRASVALQDARRQALRAQGDAQLAHMALQRLLKNDQPVRLSTPLFIHSSAIEPLEHFQQLAQQHHPGLGKIAAKTAQAQHLHEASAAGWKPSITAYGRVGRSSGSHHNNWAAGVQASWTLWSAWDRRAMSAASAQRVRQAEHTDAQVRSDIALLVEKNWRQVEDARQQFLALNADLQLAHEVLRLRQSGLRAGTSTAMDLIDAQTNLTKVETERAQAANTYVQALAQLLHSAGVPGQFARYMQQADIRLVDAPHTHRSTVQSAPAARRTARTPARKR